MDTKLAADKKYLEVLKARLPKLEELYKEVNSHWAAEDGFYRFYHQSFKVYYLQPHTLAMVKMFESIGQEIGAELNADFLRIISEGTDKKFEMEHNKDWHKHTRPILEAFFHAREFLKHILGYAKTLPDAPQMLPSGWAVALYLYNLR